jgi:NAD(P)-dependent dehydrogenase (short-subunit alcohol dehydrogenase family)
MRYNGKVAVVTGAGSGIGRGIAECLAGDGAFVVINDIRKEAAEESKRILEDKGYRSEFVVSDISTPDGAAASIDEAIRRGGRLDLLVNCAGRQIVKRMEELQPEEWDIVLGVNLKGAYLCAKAAMPFLAEKHGAIINICSVHARATIEGFTSYAASKAGILALTRAMAIECAPKGVRVNAVSPGTIDTPLLQAYFDSFPDPARARSEFLKFHPIGRFGTPRDIGEIVAFLGCTEAGFITGTEITVDGGMTALLFKQ